MKRVALFLTGITFVWTIWIGSLSAQGGAEKEPFLQNPEEYLKEGEGYHEHPEGEGLEEEVAEHKITTEEIGKQVTCPVSGEKLKVKKSTRAVEYKGEVYYFCCSKCIRRFSKNPEKYRQAVHHDESHHHSSETEHHH